MSRGLADGRRLKDGHSQVPQSSFLLLSNLVLHPDFQGPWDSGCVLLAHLVPCIPPVVIRDAPVSSLASRI